MKDKMPWLRYLLRFALIAGTLYLGGYILTCVKAAL